MNTNDKLREALVIANALSAAITEELAASKPEQEKTFVKRVGDGFVRQPDGDYSKPEPQCPECNAVVLYECPACGKSTYPSPESQAWRCVAPPCKCDKTNYSKCCYAAFGHPPRYLPEPQAQAGEPEVVGWIRLWAFNKEKPKKEKNENGRWAWPARFKFLPVTQGQCARDDLALITLQAHREAMAKMNVYLEKDSSLVQTLYIALAKRDATEQQLRQALKACVEALYVSHEQMKLYMLNYKPGWNAYDANEAAITQAKECRK